MKRILVTGGFGYVGGRIISQLLSTGEYEVLVSSRKKKILPNEFFDTKKIKIIDSNELFAEFSELPASLHSIIHLAAFNEIDCLTHTVDAADFNIISSLKLLIKAIKQKVPQFVYFSTAHVYGNALKGTITEQTIPRPGHPYSITHKAFEDFVLAARDKKEIDGIVLRLSNSIGHPVWPDVNRWTLLVNDLCRQAVTTGKLKINSAGFQKRDFVTLTDVSAATYFVMNEQKIMSSDGLFNLGGNSTLSILQMAGLIMERCKAILDISVKLECPPGTSNQVFPDEPFLFESKKLQEFGFEWQLNINQEIDSLLLFCNQHFGKK